MGKDHRTSLSFCFFHLLNEALGLGYVLPTLKFCESLNIFKKKYVHAINLKRMGIGGLPGHVFE